MAKLKAREDDVSREPEQPSGAQESRMEPAVKPAPAPPPEPKLSLADFGMSSPTDPITFAGFRAAVTLADGGRRRTLADWRRAFDLWSKTGAV